MSGRMADDFDLEPQDGNQGGGEDQGGEDELTPEQKEAKELKEQNAQLAEQLRKQAEQSERMMLHILDRAGQEATKAAGDQDKDKDKEPEPLPDRDEDPEGYLEAKLARMLDEKLDSKINPLVEQNKADRATMLQSAEVQAKEQARKLFGKKFDEMETDIEAYLASNAPAEARAYPGAWEEAFYRVAGRANFLAERDTASRSSAADDGRGRPSAAASADEGGRSAPRLDGVKERLAAFENMDADDVEAMSGKSVDIDDFLAHKAKKEKKKARRG